MPEKVNVRVNNLENNEIVKLISVPVSPSERYLCGFLFPERYPDVDFEGYAYLLTQDLDFYNKTSSSALYSDSLEEIDLKDNDIIKIDAKHQQFQFLYRVDGNANCLFVTDCCNSHCLMCPQPPKLENTVEIEQLRRHVDCLPVDLKEICVTGGDPTLLGDELVSLLKRLAKHCPECHVHMLTNARKFKDFNFARQCISAGLKGISFGIPLYSSDPECHDYIVQSKGSFAETLEGIYNLAKFDASIEIRVVLTKVNVSLLTELVDFIYRNLTFVDHIAIMGMEHMGYVKLNWGKVYIDPVDYQEYLVSAVRFLKLRGMNVSVYNLPLCILDKKLWLFSKNSITDSKRSFDEKCSSCSVQSKCGGVFRRQMGAMHIKPIVSCN